MTVVVEKVGRNVRIKAVDQGLGISQPFQPRVFQRFAREDATTTRKKNGSELGLSLCKAIMDRHGENIGFVTDKDKGSCFYIDLKQC